MRPILRALGGTALLSVIVGLTGCVDTRQQVVLNPDGTGKMAFHNIYSLDTMFKMGGKKDETPDDKARALVSSLLAKSEGVTAWKDLAYTIDGQKVTVDGTAYFADLNTLEIHGDTSGGMKFTPIVTIAGDAMTVTVGDNAKAKNKQKEPTPPAEPLSDDKVKELAKAAANKFNKQSAMMDAFFADMRMEYQFTLPGDLATSSNFTIDPAQPRSVQVVYTGPKLLAAMRQVTSADGYWEKQVRAGRDAENPDLPDGEFNAALFGTKGPVTVVTKGPLKAQFDYAAEVQAANDGYDAMVAKLKLVAPMRVVPAASGKGFKSLAVGGVQWVTGSNEETNLHLFNEGNGIKLALVVGFDGAVINVTKATLESAITDTGVSLMSDDEWKNQVMWINLNDAKDAASFMVPLVLPPADAKGYKSVKGKLEYLIAGGEKRQEVGPVELKDGATLEAVGLKIKTVSEFGDAKSLAFDIKLPENSIKGIIVRGDDGKEVVGKLSWANFWDDVCQVQAQFDRLPAKGTLIFILNDEVKAYSVPWEVKDLDLLGRPLAR